MAFQVKIVNHHVFSEILVLRILHILQLLLHILEDHCHHSFLALQFSQSEIFTLFKKKLVVPAEYKYNLLSHCHIIFMKRSSSQNVHNQIYNWKLLTD